MSNQAAQTMPELPAHNKIAHDLLIDLRAAAAIGRPITGDEIHEIEQRMLAALSHTAGVADGWKLVPVEPTDDMMDAAMQREDDEPLSSWGKIVPAPHDAIYRAMLAAAPAASGGGDRLTRAEAIAEFRSRTAASVSGGETNPSTCIHRFGHDGRVCLRCGWNFRENGDPPQPSADAVRELVKRWRDRADAHEQNALHACSIGLKESADSMDEKASALRGFADELESLLSGGPHA